MNTAHFSMPDSIPISSLLVLGFSFLFPFWQIVWGCPHTLGVWFFLTIYEGCVRICIITITYSNGGSESPWNISLWIFTRETFSCCQFHCPVFYVTLYTVKKNQLSSFAKPYRMPFWSWSASELSFFASLCFPWGSMEYTSPVPILPLRHPFCSAVYYQIVNFLLYLCLSIVHIIFRHMIGL